MNLYTLLKILAPFEMVSIRNYNQNIYDNNELLFNDAMLLTSSIECIPYFNCMIHDLYSVHSPSRGTYIIVNILVKEEINNEE